VRHALALGKPRVTTNPNPVSFGEALVVKGRGWPVIEFCSRTVRATAPVRIRAR
jgi:hypothetical protein